MCFSATASFAAASVLGVAGVIGMRKAWKTPMVWYASIPFLFGVQQAIEGVQWLLEKPSAACSVAGYGFLFFALLLWPVYVPFSIYMMEKLQWNKMALRFSMLIGALVSLYLLVPYLMSPLNVVEYQYSIRYEIAIPPIVLGMAMYVFAVVSPMWSSRPRVRAFGVAVLVGFLAAWLTYKYALTSVWCFFAAVTSIFVLTEVLYAPQASKNKRRV